MRGVIGSEHSDGIVNDTMCFGVAMLLEVVAFFDDLDGVRFVVESESAWNRRFAPEMNCLKM